MEMKFYKCKDCGKVLAMPSSSDASAAGNSACCGDALVELKANTTDAAVEKHVPVVSVNGNTVSVEVGSVTHPMSEEHYIEWISVQTSSGNQRKALKPGDPPKACFALLDGDEIEAVYAYCNLHSLWKSK